jgi:hypothetical protein
MSVTFAVKLFLGVLSLLKAENKPVEPEQGNSCEGKAIFFTYHLSISFSLFPKFIN